MSFPMALYSYFANREALWQDWASANAAADASTFCGDIALEAETGRHPRGVCANGYRGTPTCLGTHPQGYHFSVGTADTSPEWLWRIITNGTAQQP
jgi:hypothetical protein